MTKIVMPDFEEWALKLLSDYPTPREIASALALSFNQGLALGMREKEEQE